MTLFLVLITALILSLSSASATNEDILNATQEMQRANYFAFVMLINMASSNTFGGNITFLMPNDRALAKTSMAGTPVLDFLLRHSIPSPLLMDQLDNFPTGSMIPTSKPGFMFKVTNDGRRRFFLSNVRILSPNICTQGTSIRCHGIDGVVHPAMVPQLTIPPSPAACTAPAQPPAVIAAPSPTAGQVSHHKSSSRRSTVVDLLIIFFMLVLTV